MKECAICGEILDEHAFQCSKGHSVFRSSRFSNKMIKNMLEHCLVDYSKKEIVFLTKKIMKICSDAQQPITKEFLDSIIKDINLKHKKREEKILKRIEKEKRILNKDKESEKQKKIFRDEIETVLPIFQGGNYRKLIRKDFIRLFGDVFDTVLYNQLSQPQQQKVDRSYNDNKEFWIDALQGNHFESKSIFLKEFHITEWIPSSPGRFFTREAERSRIEAQKYVTEKEYIPTGKECMVLGGIGSVRLKSRIVNSMNMYFLCASSNGISHQGIPIALYESDYKKIIPLIKEFGGCCANVVGSLRVLPTNLAIIQYKRDIPKYCLLAEEIEFIRESTSEELLTTIAIVFSNYDSEEMRESDTPKLNKMWSFCSFKGSSKDELNKAVDWLKNYANRYSIKRNPPILSDFDEHYSHFDNPIEFSITSITGKNWDNKLLREYQKIYNLTLNIDGDIFNNISNSTIINKSTFEK